MNFSLKSKSPDLKRIDNKYTYGQFYRQKFQKIEEDNHLQYIQKNWSKKAQNAAFIRYNKMIQQDDEVLTNLYSQFTQNINEKLLPQDKYANQLQQKQPLLENHMQQAKNFNNNNSDKKNINQETYKNVNDYKQQLESYQQQIVSENKDLDENQALFNHQIQDFNNNKKMSIIRFSQTKEKITEFQNQMQTNHLSQNLKRFSSQGKQQNQNQKRDNIDDNFISLQKKISDFDQKNSQNQSSKSNLNQQDNHNYSSKNSKISDEIQEVDEDSTNNDKTTLKKMLNYYNPNSQFEYKLNKNGNLIKNDNCDKNQYENQDSYFKSKKYLYKELVVQSVIDFTKEKQQLSQKIEELNEKLKILGQNLDKEQNKNHDHQIKYENSEMEFQKKYEDERQNLHQRLQQSEKEKLLKTAEAEAYEKQIEQLEKQFIIFQEKQSKEIEKKNNQFNQEKMKVEQLMKETDFKHENFKENVQDIFEKYKTAICTLKLNKEKIQNLEIQIQQLQTENNRLSIRASTNFEDLTPRPNLQNFTEFMNQVQIENGGQNGLFNSQDQISNKNLQNKVKYVDFKSQSTRENISNLELKTKELFNNLKCEISNQQKVIQQLQSQNGQPMPRINLQGKKKKTIIQNSKKANISIKKDVVNTPLSKDVQNSPKIQSQQDYDSANDIINKPQEQNNFEQNQINQDDIIIENEGANTINQRKQQLKTSLDIKNFNQNTNIQDQKNSKTSQRNIQDNA